MDFFERAVLRHRTPEQGMFASRGDTLEVAIGTGLNLPHYPEDVRLTGLDLSPEMLALAETAVNRIGARSN